jgi:hypothetical protein
MTPLRDCDLFELYFSSILEIFNPSPLASAAPSRVAAAALYKRKVLQLQ